MNMLRMVRALDSNDELVDSLVGDGVLRTDRVIQAFRALPRANFLSHDLQDSAYVDTPVRINTLAFNVSAPHVYALCMESLELEPGHAFLDVGSGCGLFTAIAAQLVSPAGISVGLDLRQDIIDFSLNNIRNMRRLAAAPTSGSSSSSNNGESASHQTSLQGNRASNQATNGSAAADSASSSSSAARRATQLALDNIHFVVRNVFLPADPDEPTAEFDRIHVGASCPPDSLPHILALLKPNGILVTPSGTELLKIVKDATNKTQQTVITQVRYGDLILPSEAEILLAKKRIAEKRANMIVVPPDSFRSDFERLIGNPMMSDITFVVQDKSIPAHKVILASRSEFFNAMFTSGFQEANGSCRYDVEKDEITLDALQRILRYIYLGEEPPLTAMSEESIVDLLHAASLWQLTRLKTLCEIELRKGLSCESATSLLAIADQHAAHQLKSVVIEFILKNFDSVKTTSGFQELDRSLFIEVTELACNRLRSLSS